MTTTLRGPGRTTPDRHSQDRRLVRNRNVPAVRQARARVQAANQPPSKAFYGIAATVAVLVMLGLVMVLSASSITSFHRGVSPWRYFTKQLTWAGLGTMALLVAYRIPLTTWRRMARVAYVGSLCAMVLPFVPGIGREVEGARAWVQVGGFGFQPSEMLKLGVLLFCADLLTRRERCMADLRMTFWPCLVALTLGAGLCVVQGDLGSAVVLAGIVFAVMFIAGTPFTPMGLAAGGFTAVGLAFVLSSPRRFARWTAFLDLEGNKEHTSYQVYQAIISIANGGPTGVGVGEGTGKWGYVPLAHSDFIFAIVAEELGLVGVIAVIGGFALFTWLGVHVALNAGAAGDRFSMLLAGGIAIWFALQATINIGGVTGVMPVTGLTLPFISFGGSSLLICLAGAGLLLNVARTTR